MTASADHPMRSLLLAAAAATITTSAYAQADRCALFPSPADQARCRLELTQQPPADPYCLPMTTAQLRAVRAGQRVLVPGVGGCSQVWN
jgi:hypothetical protein